LPEAASRESWARALEKAGVELRKANDNWITVSQLLAEAKAKCDGGGFKAFKAKYCSDLSRSRIYELLAIGSGKKTLEQSRAKKRESVAKSRARGMESATGHVADSDGDAAIALPTPSEAKRIARETHTIQFASDGKMYTGASDEAIKEAGDRRSIVFGARRAIDILANMPKSPQDFLAYAQPHQLWTPEEQHLLAHARQWLNGLVDCWQDEHPTSDDAPASAEKRKAGNAELLRLFTNAADQFLPLLSPDDLEKARAYVTLDQWLKTKH